MKDLISNIVQLVVDINFDTEYLVLQRYSISTGINSSKVISVFNKMPTSEKLKEIISIFTPVDTNTLLTGRAVYIYDDVYILNKFKYGDNLETTQIQYSN